MLTVDVKREKRTTPFCKLYSCWSLTLPSEPALPRTLSIEIPPAGISYARVSSVAGRCRLSPNQKSWDERASRVLGHNGMNLSQLLFFSASSVVEPRWLFFVSARVRGSGKPPLPRECCQSSSWRMPGRYGQQMCGRGGGASPRRAAIGAGWRSERWSVEILFRGPTWPLATWLYVLFKS